MELRHLRYFIGAAEDLCFTKTAKRLHVAQPSLSRQIQQLEEEIGVELFYRHRAGVFLTEGGRVFLTEARKVIAQADHALAMARRTKSGEIGLLRVGIAWGLGDRVSRILGRHCERIPGIEIECKNMASGLQNEALRTRQIDVGFFRPFIDQVHLKSLFLFEEPMIVVLRKSSSLSRFKKLRVKALAKEPLLLIDRNVCTSAYDKTLEIYRKAAVRPQIIPTTTLPYEEAGAILVASGKGIYLGVGAHPCPPAFSDRIGSVLLDEPGAKIPVYMAWRPDESSRPVLEFVESVRRHFEFRKIRDSRSRIAARAVGE